MFMIEAIQNALAAYSSVRRWARNVIIVAAVALLLVAILVLPYGTENADQYMKVTHVAMRSVTMIQAGVLVVFFAFSRYLALSWRNYQFGILIGYGLYVSVRLAGHASMAQGGRQVAWTVMLVNSFAYLCTLLVWLIYILQQEPKVLPPPPESGKELDEWTRALSDINQRKLQDL
jgi:hypothetical protein